MFLSLKFSPVYSYNSQDKNFAFYLPEKTLGFTHLEQALLSLSLDSDLDPSFFDNYVSPYFDYFFEIPVLPSIARSCYHFEHIGSRECFIPPLFLNSFFYLTYEIFDTSKEILLSSSEIDIPKDFLITPKWNFNSVLFFDYWRSLGFPLDFFGCPVPTFKDLHSFSSFIPS